MPMGPVPELGARALEPEFEFEFELESRVRDIELGAVVATGQRRGLGVGGGGSGPMSGSALRVQSWPSGPPMTTYNPGPVLTKSMVPRVGARCVGSRKKK